MTRRTKHLGGRRCLLALACCLLAMATARAEHVLYDADGRRLEVSVSPRFPVDSRQQITHWAEQLAHSLTLVYGHWPRQRWAIEVETASGSADDPIPWAQVSRGDTDRVSFYVVSNTHADSLAREWTGYHEVSHLLLPYRGWGDTWFSEGLASYYQNLIQARAGLITEQDMWQRLHAGFERGRNDTRFDGLSLISVNRQMRRNGGYMRVYWSGAWYFLAADLRLRQRSGGSYGLDNALRDLNDCCGEDALSVPEIIHQLDAASKQSVFSELYTQLRNATQMPDHVALFAELGITIAGDDVVLSDSGAAAQRRRQFLQSTAL